MKLSAHIETIFQSLNRALAARRKPADPAEVRAVFGRFQKVLESNNRALETITDMGEKLGGDYLFDIVYVRRAYDDLKKDMQFSLRSFDTLTENRYQRIHDAFGRIDSLITGVLTDAPPLTPAPVLFLENIGWGSERAVGGKMAHLAEVRNQLGMNVPEGFVITTAAFDEFVRLNRLEDRIRLLKDAGSPSDSTLQELQELVLQGEVPPHISDAIRKAVNRIRRRGGNRFLAVRSSAEEEDGSHSFAGQFKTVLGVPLDASKVERAYRKVIASIFTEKSAAYQQQTGHEFGTIKMAVGCMVLVDARSSGVMYSTTPEGDADTMIISAGWGLGEAIVEGKGGNDLFVVRKGKEPELIRSAIGEKNSRIIVDQKGGTIGSPVPDDIRKMPSLSPEQVKTLAHHAIKIERYFGNPQDIEWAIDETGRVSILQARPLQLQPPNHENLTDRAPSKTEYRVLFREQGIVVQRGTAAGKVFIARSPSDIASLPKGAVLVAGHDSSLFVRAMPFVSAIITETGSQTSHMAALCRELNIPTIVNLPHAAEVLKPGQDITVDAGERAFIYEGIIRDLLTESGKDRQQMEAVYEFRRKRYILRYISPLHLIDPLMDEFTPERCRTMHDVLRFMHEKAVAELVESAREGGAKLRKRGMVVPLELPVPAGILLMDIGGGLQNPAKGKATLDQISSVPFRAIMTGMIHPGAWHSETIALRADDFLSSMMRMPDITSPAAGSAGYNVAVISREYVNMTIRFGYHFNMVDCYLSEYAKNNHIYFRFAGGATDLVKRSRRLELIARILTQYGFTIKIKGDLLIARLAGMGRDKMEQVLNQTGRLISYARQLDAVLRDGREVDLFVENFLNGNYQLSGKPK